METDGRNFFTATDEDRVAKENRLAEQVRVSLDYEQRRRGMEHWTPSRRGFMRAVAVTQCVEVIKTADGRINISIWDNGVRQSFVSLDLAVAPQVAALMTRLATSTVMADTSD